MASKIIFRLATMGKAKIIPDVPQSIENAIMETMAARALMLTFEPVIFGVIKLPSTNCITIKIPITARAYDEESLVANAIVAGISDPIRIPMYGINSSNAARKP